MRRRLATLCIAGLMVSACGGGDDAGDRTTSSTVAVAGEITEPTAATTDETDTTDDDTAVTVPDVSDMPAADVSAGWTVLVYSIADTDLEPFLLDDVTEMGSVGSGPGVNIVSLVDRASDYSSDPVLGLDDWQGAKVLHVQPAGAEVLADLGDVNTGDPQLLADFIANGVTAFPAEHYALVISDHGASWPGVGGDESTDHDGLSLAELQDGIAAGLAGAGVDQLDLLGFDACLMATYEVASTLAPLANRMLASQELEPGHGWNYGVLQMLNDDPTTDVDTLGAALIDGFESQATEQETVASITLSLIDLDQMPTVDAAMAEFTTALTDRAAALGPVIGRTRSSTLSFGRSPDPSSDSQMVDLGILVGEIGVDALDVSSQADDVIRALNDVVLDRVAGAAMRGATGLSIYFPTEQQWFSADYTALSAMSGWAGFLDAYYTGGAAIPEDLQPEFSTEEATVSLVDGGVEISGIFDSAAQDNLSSAVIEYGVIDADGTITYIGSEPATVSDDGSGLASGFYDLTALTMSDGIDTAFAYLDLTIDDEAGVVTIDVPLAYYQPGEDEEFSDVLLSLVLDAEGNLVSETYYLYNPEADTYGELTADPDGIVVPLVFAQTAGGAGEWVPTSDVGLYADLPSIAYDLVPLEPGTQLYVELTVTDFGGNSDTVSGSVTLG